MQNDLISRSALLDFISDERKEASDNKNHEKMRGNDYEMHFWSGALVQARWIRQYVNEAPTIDAVPVVHGRWLTSSYIPDTLICSVCGKRFDMYHYDQKDMPFCLCGAKMDGGTDNA